MAVAAGSCGVAFRTLVTGCLRSFSIVVVVRALRMVQVFAIVSMLFGDVVAVVVAAAGLVVNVNAMAMMTM